MVLGLASLLAILLPTRTALQEAAPPPRPPSFLVILADDLGAEELGCYGGEELRTPRLDALAAEGTRFTTCWATPVCTSSRNQLLTGKYGFRTGVLGNTGSQRYRIEKDLTFERLLRRGGYATAIAGKWGLLGTPADLGFDESCLWGSSVRPRSGTQELGLPPGAAYSGPVDENGVTSRYWGPPLVVNGVYRPTEPDDFGPDLFVDFLVDFMGRHREQPFLAFYSMVLPHEEQAHSEEDGPAPPVPDPEAPGGRRAAGERGLKECVDRQVGRLGDALRELGLEQSTVVLFSADNAGVGPRGKGRAVESAVRVPLIVRGPGVARGVVSEALVDFSDVLPTLAELAGLEPPEGIDGVSFAPALRGEPGRREWIFSYLNGQRLLRDRRWLLEEHRRNRFGSFYDCGGRTAGRATDERAPAYTDVSDSSDPEVLAARERFLRLLEALPAPTVF